MQPVLIFFETGEKLESFKKYYSRDDKNIEETLNIVNAGASNLKDKISKAMFRGQVSLFGREFGRGTDLFSYDEVISEAGGSIVI